MCCFRMAEQNNHRSIRIMFMLRAEARCLGLDRDRRGLKTTIIGDL